MRGKTRGGGERENPNNFLLNFNCLISIFVAKRQRLANDQYCRFFLLHLIRSKKRNGADGSHSLKVSNSMKYVLIYSILYMYCFTSIFQFFASFNGTKNNHIVQAKYKMESTRFFLATTDAS